MLVAVAPAAASVSAWEPPRADRDSYQKCEHVRAAYRVWRGVWDRAEVAIAQAPPPQRYTIGAPALMSVLEATSHLRLSAYEPGNFYIRNLNAASAVFTVRLAAVILAQMRTGVWAEQDWTALGGASAEVVLSYDAVNNTCPGGVLWHVTPAATR